MRLLVCTASLAVSLLAGCDMLGIESPEKIAAAREADGRAIGGACRHAGRAIEDCYALNKKADKASVFAGWRDMNDYMRENKIDAVAPTLGAPVARTAKADDADAAEKPEKAADKKPAAEKAAPEKAADHGDKPAAKPARTSRATPGDDAHG